MKSDNIKMSIEDAESVLKNIAASKQQKDVALTVIKAHQNAQLSETEKVNKEGNNEN